MTTNPGPTSIRLTTELQDRIDALDGGSRQEKILSLIQRGLDCPEGLEPVLLSESQIKCCDQLAERWETSRGGAIYRMLRERLDREYVEERQRQAFRPKEKLKAV